MNISWYLTVSALVFSIGAAGVLTRRSPLVILLCLELMLNAANLSLIAFSRMWGNGDGQIFAIVALVAAARGGCPELRDRRVGRGGVRGLHRPRPGRGDLPPAPADRRRRDAGAARVSPTTSAWLALASPLAGAIINGLGYRAFRGRLPGIIGTAALALAFVFSVITVVQLQGHDPEHRQLVSSLYDYVVTGTVDARMSILVDPLSVLMMLVVSGVSMLIHVYSFSYMGGDRGYARFFAYLNFFVFSMMLLVLAANFVLLIVGWAFVGAASYLLISFWYRRTT